MSQGTAKQDNAKPAGGGQRAQAGKRKRRRRARRPGRLRRWLGVAMRWARRIVVAAIMVPIVLVPLYAAVPPISTLMIWQALGGVDIDRRWIELDDMAPALVATVLMSEDGRYCDHGGVDWDELNKVLESANGPTRGASTIAMQTVKNVFLWQSRSVIRKALELPLAMFADTVWGKRRLMEIYLNVVEWGPGVFGAEAAAQHHFGRSAGRLTARQASLLAVSLPNPHLRDPGRPSARLDQLARKAAARGRASGAYTDCLAAQGPL